MLSVSSNGSTPLQHRILDARIEKRLSFSILKRIDPPATGPQMVPALAKKAFQYPQTDRPPCNKVHKVYTVHNTYAFSILKRIDPPATYARPLCLLSVGGPFSILKRIDPPATPQIPAARQRSSTFSILKRIDPPATGSQKNVKEDRIAFSILKRIDPPATLHLHGFLD